MIPKRTTSRRTWLKTFAGIGAASQFTGLFQDLWADASPVYPRFIVLGSPHGYAPMFWRPQADTTSPTGFTLNFPNSSLSPLEKHKDSLVIIEGLDLATDWEGTSYGIDGGHNTISTLTGIHPKAPCCTPDQYVSSGPSIDYYLSKVLNTSPFFFNPTGYVMGVFREDGTPVQPESDLSSSFKNWFGSLDIAGPTDPKADAKKAAQQATIDYVAGEAKRLQSRLAGTERAKLDAHLDALNTISHRINAVAGASCAKPTATPNQGAIPSGDKYIPMVLDFTAEIVACNLSRVINVSVDPINSGKAPWLADQDPIFATAAIHNDIAHGFRPDDVTSQRRLATIHNWYAQQISYFFDRLKAIPEGNGTAYDNSIILWAGDLGDPARHGHTNIPFVLAGGGGSWKKGRYLQFNTDVLPGPNDAPHSPLLTSVANEFGANLTYFGDPRFTGPLPHL